MSEIKWSETEDKIARRAFDIAYERETLALIEGVRAKASAIAKLDDLWHLNDILSSKRYEIDGKYDYSHASLIFTFAGLLQEKWINLEELKGINPDKIAKIAALSRMQ